MTAVDTGRTRVQRLTERLDGRAHLVTDPSDVRWLSGFSGSNGWLLVHGTTAWLVTDGRYVEQAERETAGQGIEVVEARSRSLMVDAVVARCPDFGARFDRIDLALYADFTARGARLVDGSNEVATLRRVKDPSELARIERACAIADLALREVLESIGEGDSERDLRDELEHRMRRHGADGPSYDTIVASGPTNSACPHHRPTDRRLTRGDSVVIDVGALVDGFHSDMTRTVFVGDPPSDLHHRYELVAEAQMAGLATVRAGVAASAVDEACRAVFRRAGVLDDYVHGSGHGVGLDIHEIPFLGPSATEELVVGEVVTVEPGLYRKEVGGVRIEDLVLVLADGHRILTGTTKELTCLPSRPTT